MIFGIGVDTVQIDRFERALERTPALRTRLFTNDDAQLPTHSLAARFAAYEALIKALGDSHSLAWHDMRIEKNGKGAPEFVRTQALAALLTRLHADRVHVSMTHDGNYATAFVIVESSGGAA